MKQFWSDLPMWGKVVMIIIIIIILYVIYRWVKNKVNSANYNASVSQSVTAINQLASQGIRPSYAEAQYTSWANNLQGAFQGCSAAGNSSSFWQTIEPIFKAMKNDADIYSLISHYGVREVDKCGLFTGDFEGDLAATLSEKFSGLEGAVIRYDISDINKILKSNGLTFTF